VAVLSPIGFAISNLSMAGLAYLLQEWGLLTLTITCFSLPFFIATWFLPESARWLAASGRKEAADELIEKMAQVNRVELPKKFKLHVEKPARRYSPIDLFATPNLRKFTLITCGVWSLAMMAYYGKFVNTHYLPGSIYVHFGLNSLIDIPAMMVYGPIMSKSGRKVPLSVSLIVCGFSLIMCVVIPSDRSSVVLTSIHVVIYVIGKVAISGAFAILHLHTVEAYPTLLRTMGLAVATSAGRLAGTLGYAIDLLDVYSDIISHTVFALAAIAGGVLALMLPETKGWPLLDTVSDGEKCAHLQPTWEKWETWEKWQHARMTRQPSMSRQHSTNSGGSDKDSPENERLTESASAPSMTPRKASENLSDSEIEDAYAIDSDVENGAIMVRERLNTNEFGRQLSDASRFDRSKYSEGGTPIAPRKVQTDIDNNLTAVPSTSTAEDKFIRVPKTISFHHPLEEDDPARQMVRM
jgi:hypothetical protein